MAPYLSFFERDQGYSFISQLVKNNIIDHPTFSIYSKETLGEKMSVIKFGGYDQKALASKTQLTILRTMYNTTWGLNSTEFMING